MKRHTPEEVVTNGKLRDEHLSQELFGSLAEAVVLTERWRRHDNESRPSARHGGAERARLPCPGRLRGLSVLMNRRRHYHTGWYEKRGPVTCYAPSTASSRKDVSLCDPGQRSDRALRAQSGRGHP